MKTNQLDVSKFLFGLPRVRDTLPFISQMGTFLEKEDLHLKIAGLVRFLVQEVTITSYWSWQALIICFCGYFRKYIQRWPGLFGA